LIILVIGVAALWVKKFRDFSDIFQGLQSTFSRLIPARFLLILSQYQTKMKLVEAGLLTCHCTKMEVAETE